MWLHNADWLHLQLYIRMSGWIMKRTNTGIYQYIYAVFYLFCHDHEMMTIVMIIKTIMMMTKRRMVSRQIIIDQKWIQNHYLKLVHSLPRNLENGAHDGQVKNMKMNDDRVRLYRKCKICKRSNQPHKQ